ncbi:MAG: transporter [Brevundimonas sp.]
MSSTTGRALAACMMTAGLSLSAYSANAQTLPASEIPALVAPPNGINLGSTSFYDGFSTLKPGLTGLAYLRYEANDAITNVKGDDDPAFEDPQVDVTTLIAQVSYVSRLKVAGGALGFDVLMPFTNIDAEFGAAGRQLVDNGLGLGDLTFGPFIQFAPMIRQGRPVASARIALDVIAPTGDVDESRDLNQGSGAWSINPYVAWTLLPAPGWEVSGRTQYLYSFETDKIPNPPSIPGFTFEDGQGGQLIWSSFTVSKEVSRGVSVGLNGYALQQITEDRINGIDIPDTKRQALYVGPGLHFDRLPAGILNLNLYLPVHVENMTSGPRLNAQFIRPF